MNKVRIKIIVSKVILLISLIFICGFTYQKEEIKLEIVGLQNCYKSNYIYRGKFILPKNYKDKWINSSGSNVTLTSINIENFEFYFEFGLGNTAEIKVYHMNKKTKKNTLIKLFTLNKC